MTKIIIELNGKKTIIDLKTLDAKIVNKIMLVKRFRPDRDLKSIGLPELEYNKEKLLQDLEAKIDSLLSTPIGKLKKKDIVFLEYIFNKKKTGE